MAYLKRTAELAPEPLKIYVVGGWVRDKMLGRQASDIDILIDSESQTVSAAAFAELVTKTEEGADTFGIKEGGTRLNGKLKLGIAFTAINLGGDRVQVDICSYTKSDGAGDKSNYNVGKIDALTRDFTINSFAYDVHEDTIVDRLDTRAEYDLRQSQLCTCEPLVFDTFRHDPIRIIRLARFAAQLDFCVGYDEWDFLTLLDGAESVLFGDEVRRNPQRMAVELDKILKLPTDQCSSALNLLYEFKAWQAIVKGITADEKEELGKANEGIRNAITWLRK